jgi:hypothetical protein
MLLLKLRNPWATQWEHWTFLRRIFFPSIKYLLLQTFKVKRRRRGNRKRRIRRKRSSRKRRIKIIYLSHPLFTNSVFPLKKNQCTLFLTSTFLDCIKNPSPFLLSHICSYLFIFFLIYSVFLFYKEESFINILYYLIRFICSSSFSKYLFPFTVACL